MARLIDLMRNAGDQHVGQTLVRLAHLAVVADQFEHAYSNTELLREDQHEVERISPQAHVHARDDADSLPSTPAHMEVSR